MKKSTLIATCLVNSSMFGCLEAAEAAVRSIFADEFPESDFAHWNRCIDDASARDMIRAIGRASRINVRKLIESLW